MDLKLNGKRALVTGSSAGLGEAIARLLAQEGVTVVVHGRDARRAHAVAEVILSEGGQAEVALGDLATDEGADVVAAKAQDGGAIDILVNNAGYYHHLNWTSALPAQWADTYQVNVLSAVRMIQRLVPTMRERGWGRVIQIGGGLAGQPVPMQPDYNAALAARHNLAVSLARDLADSGVTSNTVAPGAILVPAVRELLMKIAPQRGWGDTWEEIERACVRDMVPNDVGRLGRAEEVAAAVAFLASPHAAYVSGATLRVDGGTIRSVF
ncbi:MULTISPECIES: SDR family NAD(P)-dependent oxidoreductase [Burkholderia]|uniref:SDR family NAD(P)-dependent oxidoreductase n=1 Tax=Burkholderia TaxID=32008 RepID=UPI00075D0D68|nr:MULTISPECIES: SDR family NAD(P)-dependent oxidoreductase [Burkholderia]KVM69239.1 short-chain dehydrogenase [Burkholderia gladioli]NBI50329.1 SDR family NAD(P)-dependent oxidoreductase [Burkholderia sp. ISTR5]